MESQDSVALIRRPRRAFSPPFTTFIPDSQPHESVDISDSQPLETVEEMVAAAGRLVATGDGKKLDNAALGLIVDWLEVPGNFQQLNGSGPRTENGVRHTAKKTTYQIMLIELWARGFPKFVANGDNLGKRVVRYQQKYKDALTFKHATGSGLTERELRLGMTMESKLEKMCPFFSRLHALYGERHNVRPPTIANVGIPGLPASVVVTPVEIESSDSDSMSDAEEVIREHEGQYVSFLPH